LVYKYVSVSRFLSPFAAGIKEGEKELQRKLEVQPVHPAFSLKYVNYTASLGRKKIGKRLSHHRFLPLSSPGEKRAKQRKRTICALTKTAALMEEKGGRKGQ